MILDESRQTYRYTSYCKPISCPTCHKRTDITKNDVENLPDNFLLCSLSSIIEGRKKDNSACDICVRRPKGDYCWMVYCIYLVRFIAACNSDTAHADSFGSITGRRPVPVQRCLECDKQLCKRCVIQHQETKVTQHHSLYSLSNAYRLMCPEHDDEAVRFLCKTCAKCVCVFCTYTTHRQHDLVSILEGSENYQQQIDQTMNICRSRIVSLSDKLRVIQLWERRYNETKEQILATVSDLLHKVNTQRQTFLDNLDKMFGPDILELVRKKSDIIENLEGLSRYFYWSVVYWPVVYWSVVYWSVVYWSVVYWSVVYWPVVCWYVVW